MDVRFSADLVLDYFTDDYARGRMNACTYCGSTVAITRDHVIPVAWARPSRDYSAGDCVKCCVECNTTLSDHLLFSIESRAQYLLARYQHKYRKILMIPSWSQVELFELDHGLRKSVEASINEREFILKRLSHITNLIGDEPNISVRQVSIDADSAYRSFSLPFDDRSITSILAYVETVDGKYGIGSSSKYMKLSDYHSARVRWLYDRKMDLDLKIEKVIKAKIKLNAKEAKCRKS